MSARGCRLLPCSSHRHAGIVVARQLTARWWWMVGNTYTTKYIAVDHLNRFVMKRSVYALY